MKSPATENAGHAAESFEERLESLLARTRLSARNGVESVDVCGVPVDNMTLRSVLRSVCIQVSQRSPGYIVTPNVDHVCRYHRHPEFRKAYDRALLSLADGTPLLWAGRLLGKPLREKLSGSDMVYRLSEFAAAKGFSVYFLGAAEGVAAEAARRLELRYTGLRIAGIDSPPVGFERDPALNEEVIRRMRDSNPDICFVALGSPKQELWMEQNCTRSRVPVMIGVGGSLDFVAGRTRRAPVWMQRSGFEWAWRLCHEPKRLWRRYLVDDSFFVVLLGRYYATRLRGRLKTFTGEPVEPIMSRAPRN